jgi:hypothetical protein
MLDDANGTPLLIATTPANIRDEVPFIGMLDDLPAVSQPNGHRKYKPDAAMADRGYGFPSIIQEVLARSIKSLIAPRGTGHGSGLGRFRYVVERTMAWMAGFRRINHCYERTGEHWQAFNELACCMICARKLHDHNAEMAAA